MITLYNFGPFHSLPDASPFCLKVDAWMRMAGIEFTSSSGAGNLRRAPKGKLPFIEDNGRIIADSAFIIDYLKITYGDRLDHHLDAEQRATAHAFIKLMDENLYWCMVYSRWMDEQCWPVTRENFFGTLPYPLKLIIPPVVRRQIRKALYMQGMGRHRPEEILEIARRDLDALSGFLGNKSFFFGDSPATLDAVAYAFLAEMIRPQMDNPLNSMARSYANLVAFSDRIKNKYYIK